METRNRDNKRRNSSIYSPILYFFNIHYQREANSQKMLDYSAKIH